MAAAVATRLHAQGVRVLPYKPALSGANPADNDNDATRLLEAIGRRRDDWPKINPLVYQRPVSPGVAHSATPFLHGDKADYSQLELVCKHLDQLETRENPDLTIIEAAGGLWVPMPGGTWQPEWITRLAAVTLLVARPNLGTINHTLLTLRELTAMDREPFGFVFFRVRDDEGLAAQNGAIIEQKANVPFLGTLDCHASCASPRRNTGLPRVVSAIERLLAGEPGQTQQ